MRQLVFASYGSLLLALASCANQTALRIEDFNAVAECAPQQANDSARGVGVSASVLPLQIPAAIHAPDSATETFARRVVITFTPGSLTPRNSLLWTHLSLRTLGGTLTGWTRFQSDGALIDVTYPADETKLLHTERAGAEHAAIAAGTGYITVDRAASTGRGISNAIVLDLLVTPGGVPIDESVVRIQQLWNTDGAPVSPENLRIELVPTRHTPGYDIVEASIQLDFIRAQGHRGSKTPAPCRASAQTRATLIDADAVRPALWDLGVSSLNSPRTRWLALSGPATGVVRAVFESPTAATSFANWVRATQSANAGDYRLGLFERSGRPQLRPLAPVDLSATETFHPLVASEARTLRVGPLGEP